MLKTLNKCNTFRIYHMFLGNMNQSDFSIFIEKEIDRRLRILTLRNGEIVPYFLSGICG